MLSDKKDFSSGTFAVVAAPQHLMNLAQACLAGLAPEPFELVVLVDSRKPETYGGDVMLGALEIFSEFFKIASTKILHLKRGTWNAQLALAIRKTNRNKSARDVACLGLTPSGMWSRSYAVQNARKVILLDDGSETLVTEFGSLLDGQPSTSHGRIWDFSMSRLAGRSSTRNLEPRFYTCFGISEPSVQVIEHRYYELNSLLDSVEQDFDQKFGHKTKIYIDSCYQWLGSDLHLSLVRKIHEEMQFNVYVPHRRTPSHFSKLIAKTLNVDLIRPPVPIELMIRIWTSRGSIIYIPPTSLAVTASFFAKNQKQLKLISISKWLESQRHLSIIEDESDFIAYIQEAEMCERLSEVALGIVLTG